MRQFQSVLGARAYPICSCVDWILRVFMCFSVVKTGYNKFALNSKHLEIKDMSKVC